jgi:predicted Zn finger-like uncharacterized protein
MDVRCEKCMTVYEFDDAKVGEHGVTVKCTQCGNLFKVRRRETAEMVMTSAAARSPAYIPPAADEPAASSPARTSPRSTLQGYSPLAGTAPAPAPTPTPTPAPTSGWMIRRAGSTQVYRFREMTTLQQWIVERKVTRQDEISRNGESWKALGGIGELAAFFQIVDEASRVERMPMAPQPTPAPATAPARPTAMSDDEGEDPALTTTAPMLREPSGPVAMGRPVHADEPAFTANSQQLSPPPGTLGGEVGSEVGDDDLEPPRRRLGLTLIFAMAALLVGGSVGYLALFRRDAISGLFTQADTKAQEAYRQGREQFLLDSDDAFGQAMVHLQRAHELDAKSAVPLAALAEVKATWAQYLRDDARALESGGATGSASTAAKALRRQAQAHLDEAKQWANEALTLDPESPEVNRAMADYLRVDGAPAAEVDRYLKRALDRRPNDAESVYVQAALDNREGQSEQARALLTQANQLNRAATQHALLRASYLLARLQAAAGDKAGAKQTLEPVIAANAQHDRARALMATFDTAAPAAPPAAVAAVPAAAPAPAAGAPAEAAPPAAAATAAPSPTSAPAPAGGEDYARSVAQADRLLENGHAQPARKLYEKALQQRPGGPEALTGLGYCDLDGEKFGSAIDHFKQALASAPSFGEAIIGLAEAYKSRGDRGNALAYYKQYLAAQPSGPKAMMAKNNIRDLEPRAQEAPPASAEPPPSKDKSPEEPKRSGDTARAAPASDDKPVALPHLPPSEQPPPN